MKCRQVRPQDLFDDVALSFKLLGHILGDGPMGTQAHHGSTAADGRSVLRANCLHAVLLSESKAL